MNVGPSLPETLLEECLRITVAEHKLSVDPFFLCLLVTQLCFSIQMYFVLCCVFVGVCERVCLRMCVCVCVFKCYILPNKGDTRHSPSGVL